MHKNSLFWPIVFVLSISRKVQLPQCYIINVSYAPETFSFLYVLLKFGIYLYNNSVSMVIPLVVAIKGHIISYETRYICGLKEISCLSYIYMYIIYIMNMIIKQKSSTIICSGTFFKQCHTNSSGIKKNN